MTKGDLRALLNELFVCDPINATKKQLEALLDESFKSMLNIAVPVGATKEQLEKLIRKYFREAAAVDTDEGVDFKLTDRPTRTYYVDFTLRGRLSIRADSKKSAAEWIDSELVLFDSAFSGTTLEDAYRWIDGVYLADDKTVSLLDYDIPRLLFHA